MKVHSEQQQTNIYTCTHVPLSDMHVQVLLMSKQKIPVSHTETLQVIYTPILLEAWSN